MPRLPQRLRTPSQWRPLYQRVHVPVQVPAIIQEGFRWRNDDGSQTTATWKAAQDTNTSLALATSVRLRVLLDANVNPPPTPFTLYYKKTTDSTWLPVPVGAGGGSVGGSEPFLQSYFSYTGSNGAAWPSPWTTVNGTIQTNRGRLAPGAAGYAVARAHTTGLDIADVRVTGTFRVNTLSEQYPAIGVRHNGAWNGGLVDEGIIMYIGVAENTFDLQIVDAGAYVVSIGTAAAITWAVNTDYRFTIEVIEGTGVTYGRAKVWAATAYALEPEGWMVDGSTSNAARPASGGVSAATVTGASDATSYIEVDDLIIQDYDDDRVRVLAIGDSITAGPYNHPNYPAVATWRRYFFDDHEATTSLQMVGQNWSCGVADGSGNLGSYAGLGTWDHDHHARNSWSVDDALADAADDVTNYQPDVAIVYIGLNDLLDSASAATTAGKVGDIIDAVRAAKADVKFVLCQIAPSTAIGTVTAYNTALASLAAAETTPTSPIEVADCNTGFNGAWIYDTIHPNDTGDQFIADAITVAFDAVISGSPNPVYVSASANITSSGEATTALLTAPSGKTTADFSVGRMWDDENGTDLVDIAGGPVVNDYDETDRVVTITATVTSTDSPGGGGGGPAFSDDFNRSDRALDNGWVNRATFTAATIASNRAVAPSGTESQCYHPTDVGSEDMYTEADIHLGGGGDYPTVSVRNQTAARTCYFFYHEPGGTNQFTISKFTGGTFFTISTQTGPTVGSVPCDYTLRLEAQGTTLRGYVNGTLAVTTTDSSVTSSQRYGGFTFYNGSGASYIDNFETGAL